MSLPISKLLKHCELWISGASEHEEHAVLKCDTLNCATGTNTTE